MDREQGMQPENFDWRLERRNFGVHPGRVKDIIDGVTQALHVSQDPTPEIDENILSEKMNEKDIRDLYLPRKALMDKLK